MKVALAYDWLNIKIGGGEQTFFEIARLYPDADIYCLIYNPNKFDQELGKRKIITSRLNRFPGFMKRRPYLLLPYIQKAVEQLDFSGYDLIISVSSAWVKNITVPEKTHHISYCFSPARMIWDSWPGYLDTQKIGPFKLGRISRFFITKSVSKLRLWDYYRSGNVDSFVAISKFVAARIAKYYHREAAVVYPPVEIDKFEPTSEVKRAEYYLCVSTLSRYKNISLAVEVFAKSNMKDKQLLIAGDGPDRDRLLALAKGRTNIKFLGRVSEADKIQLLQKAKAFIFPSIEDFGIAPVEALAAGTPVIALRGGGLSETISDECGVFFDQPTPASLSSTIVEFENKHFESKRLIARAAHFSAEKFRVDFVKAIEHEYNKPKRKQRGKENAK